MLKLFNTLTRKIEEFSPLTAGKVGLYTCGPTVYDFQHIGNFRTAIFSDILIRILKTNDFQVKSIRNITDIEDKIIKKSAEMGVTPEELTNKYTQAFFNDLNKLNILPADVSPKATEHIEAMLKYIKVLIDRRFAYIENDGSIYFDISKFSDYGKLSQLDKRQLKTGTRILSDEYDKENVQDFALWKAVKPQEVGYDSPWGRGRPGWHIECSVMSQQYLGDTFDIHIGGVDLLFPHHENEIAQSEAKTGKQFVKYFVHGEHLMVDGKKMAKSENNFYTLKDLEEKGFDPLAFRYLVLTAHYRDKLNFTWESLQAAQNALNNLREIARDFTYPKDERLVTTSLHPRGILLEKFMEALNNDLNTPQALAVMWELVKSDLPDSEKAITLLEMDKVLGLGLDKYIGKPLEIPAEVMILLEKRETVRKSGNFEKSDEIRKEIKRFGYEIEDTQDGPRLKPTY